MTTVLLWGHRWWLPGRTEPVAFGGLSEAADALSAAWPDRPRRLRLVYQPDRFSSEEISCPNGGRVTMRLALGGQRPALLDPAIAWGHELVLPAGESFSTILHSEAEPGLFGLVAELERHGFDVESAWPLPTWLNALPEEWSDSGGVAVAIARADAACLYAHTAAGARIVEHWHGNDALPALTRAMGAIMVKDAGGAVLIAPADEVAAAALIGEAALTESPNVHFVALAEALERTAVLPARHPAQLLPPAPLVTASRAVMVASIAFLAFAGWTGATYARDCLAWRTEGETREAQDRALRAEVSHLRSNAAEIAALRTTLAGEVPAAPAGELLRRLGATTPPEIALNSVRTTGEGFTLQGYLAPGAPKGAWEKWLAQFTQAAPFVLHTIAAPAAGGAFTLQGLHQS